MSVGVVQGNKDDEDDEDDWDDDDDNNGGNNNENEDDFHDGDDGGADEPNVCEDGSFEINLDDGFEELQDVYVDNCLITLCKKW